jgi:hypothetical protein
MEKDDKVEINVELLLESADKIIHDPALGMAPSISRTVEEILINGKLYELCLELKLKGELAITDKLIV